MQSRIVRISKFYIIEKFLLSSLFKKMNLKKFIYAYKRDQTIGLINTFFGKIGIKYRLKNSIQKRILFLQKSLKDITKNVVQSGNYKEMKIGDIAWIEYDYCPKILGFYEEEVQKELCKINCKYILNITLIHIVL